VLRPVSRAVDLGIRPGGVDLTLVRLEQNAGVGLGASGSHPAGNQIGQQRAVGCGQGNDELLFHGESPERARGDDYLRYPIGDN